MELLLFLGAIIVLDVLALEFGTDSRDPYTIDAHDRAVMAIRSGDADLFRAELARMERDITRNGWRL